MCWITHMELLLCTLGLCCWLSLVPLSASEQRVVALPGLSSGSRCDTRVGRAVPTSLCLCCTVSMGSQLNTQSSNISNPRVECPTPEMPLNVSCALVGDAGSE